MVVWLVFGRPMTAAPAIGADVPESEVGVVGPGEGEEEAEDET